MTVLIYNTSCDWYNKLALEVIANDNTIKPKALWKQYLKCATKATINAVSTTTSAIALNQTL